MKEQGKGINLLTYEFKKNLINCINTSELPISIIKYVLKDCYEQAVQLETNQIQNEQQIYDNFVTTQKKDEMVTDVLEKLKE